MKAPKAADISLALALRLDQFSRAALVGAGGKTSALFIIARQLQQQLASPVLLSASTHLAQDQLARADSHFEVHSARDFPEKIARSQGVCLFTGPLTSDERASGLEFPLLEQLAALAQQQTLPLIIEADGSRRLPLKAPAPHEPAIPGFANLVVVVAGLSGLGLPLLPENVHRPGQFAALSGLSPGEIITPQAVAKVLCSPLGGLKNIPHGSRRAVILNQADSPALREQASLLASSLIPAYHSVLAAALNPPSEEEQAKVFWVHEQTAGIILAAGGAKRFGSPKQLADWEGMALVRRAALAALEAGLDPVLVVTGAYAAEIETALAGLPVQFVHNPTWQAGQSTSLQAGLRALPLETGSVIFLLADQPALTSSLIQALLKQRRQSFAPLVVPRVGIQRANPVLFDRLTFPHLLELKGDMGGRSLLTGDSPFSIAWVDWPDPAILLDIDSPQDYARLLHKEQHKDSR
jgi:molybdenum cofactor cytidylyltransferase